MMLTGERPSIFFSRSKIGSQESLVLHRIAQVVDRQDDDRLDPLFADPLRRDQFRRIAADVIRIARAVEVSQAVAGLLRSAVRDQAEQENECEGGSWHGKAIGYSLVRATSGADTNA